MANKWIRWLLRKRSQKFAAISKAKQAHVFTGPANTCSMSKLSRFRAGVFVVRWILNFGLLDLQTGAPVTGQLSSPIKWNIKTPRGSLSLLPTCLDLSYSDTYGIRWLTSRPSFRIRRNWQHIRANTFWARTALSFVFSLSFVLSRSGRRSCGDRLYRVDCWMIKLEWNKSHYADCSDWEWQVHASRIRRWCRPAWIGSATVRKHLENYWKQLNVQH